MGKTSQPVSILTTYELASTEEFQALAAQGHQITVADWAGYDLVVGPRCWRLLPDMLKFLPLALKEARAQRPRKVKKK